MNLSPSVQVMPPEQLAAHFYSTLYEDFLLFTVQYNRHIKTVKKIPKPLKCPVSTRNESHLNHLFLAWDLTYFFPLKVL
jgi:hypothetical protein